jgi:8-oxo-dGTP pyrophosphatase MutT (NUDIX family)
MLPEIKPERTPKAIKASIFVVMDKEGSILYETRPDSDEYLGGYNIFPGGKAEKEETSFTTLTREFEEETGAKITKCYFLGNFDNSDYRGRLYNDSVCLITSWEGKIGNTEPNKGIHHWAKLEELRKLMKLDLSLKILTMTEEFISSEKARLKRD